MNGFDTVADLSNSQRDGRIVGQGTRLRAALSGRVILIGTIIGCALTWLCLGYWLLKG